MLKKSLSLLLAVMMLASVTLVSAAKFSDMTSSYDWAKEAVETLSDNGIINGYPEGTFKPGNNITKEEAIALFARTLGLSDEVNESVASFAAVQFEDTLKKYDTYAKDAAAYLLYKKVLTSAELDAYLSKTNKGKTLKRYEAATLIAKCLGGDVWLKTNPDITLNFSDAASIPANAKGYVYFASEAGIIGSMDKDLNTFVPNGDVTRAQIATMIYRIISRMQYTYVSGVITDLNTTTNTITVRDSFGETEAYIVNNSIALILDGAQSSLAKFKVGQDVIITFAQDALYSIDVISKKTEDSFVGIYKGKNVDDSDTIIKITTLDTDEALTYPLADEAVITYNGEECSISNIANGDQMMVTVKNGKIVAIYAEPKTKTISGATVEAIAYEPDVTIKIKTSTGTISSYHVKDGATIRKNSEAATFSELAIGDKVSLTLEYNKISAVSATGISKKVTGTIEEITISKLNSVIKINNGSTTTAYTVSRDAKYTLDGAEATIYDMRLGYTVEVDTSSATITKVVVKSVSAPLQITGQITLINTAYNMIRIGYVDANGNDKEETVFLKTGAKILDSNDGKIKTISQLKVGQNVTVAGAENLGIFEASSIMILSSK